MRAAVRFLHAEDPWIPRLVLSMVIFSVGCLLAAWSLGLAWGGDIRPPDSTSEASLENRPERPKPPADLVNYLEDLGWKFDPAPVPPTKWRGYVKTSWVLYPVFFLLIALPVFATWHPFLEAWNGLRQTGVLHKTDAGGSPATEADGEFVVGTLRRLRYRGFLFAILIALALTIYDFRDVFRWYSLHLTVADVMTDASPLMDRAEYDFTIAWAVDLHLATPDGTPGAFADLNMLFNVVAYLQQVVMGALGILVLVQISIHSWVFWFFERLHVARDRQLTISLRPESPLLEFGLEDWNQALNNTFWFLAAGIAIAIVLSLRQASGGDFGQTVIHIGVSLLVAAPLVLTILGRQRRLPAIWERIRSGELSGLDVKLFHDQRLWPLDRNWVSKSGIILTMFLLAYFLGIGLPALIP